jgi:hypothetical protein
MITVSLQKSFAGTQYKPLPMEKWRVVHEEPKEKYPRLVLRLTNQQCATLTEQEIETMFEAEHERKCEELESSLDLSDEKNEDIYATFATKGNNPARRYLLVKG